MEILGDFTHLMSNHASRKSIYYMANRFTFRLSEHDLITLLADLERKKVGPHHTLYLEVSVDLVANGIGYAIVDLQTNIVEEDTKGKEPHG